MTNIEYSIKEESEYIWMIKKINNNNLSNNNRYE